MDESEYHTMVRKAARAICASTNVAKPGEPDVIYDAPDDLSWDVSEGSPRAIPRWRIYEKPARAAIEALGIADLQDRIAAVLRAVERGRAAAAPQILDHALSDIETLVRGILTNR